MKEAFLLYPMLKQIPNYPRYFADEDGNIYSTFGKNQYSQCMDNPRKIKPFLNKDHLAINLYSNKKMKTFYVHVLILNTFVSNRPVGKHGCHRTPDIYDNSVKNLYWGTPKQNMADREKHGNTLRGEKSPVRVLNNLQVRIIKRAYKMTINEKSKGKKISFIYLAKIFNCGETTVSHILSGRTWKHIL